MVECDERNYEQVRLLPEKGELLLLWLDFSLLRDVAMFSLVSIAVFDNVVRFSTVETEIIFDLIISFCLG
jgi:hypothetical protein